MATTDWSGVVNTTAQWFMKGASDLTIRYRPVFNRMLGRGRITFNWSGTEVQWQVKFALPETVAYSGEPLDFEASDKYRKCSLDWRGYKVTDMMTELDRLKNRGVPQLIDRYANIMKDMKQSIEDSFSGELYNDGYTNTDRFHGLESLFRTGATYTVVAADRIVVPDSTYAGRATKPAAEAGTWSADTATKPNASLATDWPEGKGSTEYDHFSPKMLKTDSTSWKAGTTEWIDVATRVIRQGVLWATLTSGPNGKPDIGLLSQDYYYDYANSLEPKQRIVVPFVQSTDMGTMRGQGQEAYQVEGVPIITEFGMSPTTGYLLNTAKMEMRCMYSQLYFPRGPEYDIRTDAWLFALGAFGNFAFEPKFQAKLYPFAVS